MIDSQNSYMLPTGTVLSGRYEILGVLGEGGFAVVYRGRDIEIERDIAIKVLNLGNFDHDPAAYDNVVKRFRREARTSARIQHLNAVTIYDFGETDKGSPFIVMELLEGHDLEVELTTRGALTPERAVRLFVPALEALGKGHKLGIVHKDLKPSNLFITAPGTPEERMVILDFGVARVNTGEDSAKLTSAGQVLGTPQYMAPEYIESQTATPALDIYQMGLILAEALTGKPVVDEDNMVTCLIIHTTGQIEVPAQIVGSPVGKVIGRAIAKDHTRRYEDGYAFRQALLDLDLLNTAAFKAVTGAEGASEAPAREMGSARTEVVDWSPESDDKSPTSPPTDPVPSSAPAVTQAPAPVKEGSGWLVKLGIGAGVVAVLGVLGFMGLLAFMILALVMC